MVERSSASEKDGPEYTLAETARPLSFAVGGYPPDACTGLLSLRLRDNADTRRLLEQLKDLPDLFARGASLTIFVAGEWVGERLQPPPSGGG